MPIELAVTLTLFAMLSILLTYLLIGAVLTIDTLIYLRMTKNDDAITVGRVTLMVLFWLPRFILIRLK